MASHVRKSWNLLPFDRQIAERLGRQMDVSPLVAHLLIGRGFTEAEAGQRFLESPLSHLHDVVLLPGVEEASRRILDAVRAGRKICVYGDYDVDGTSGTAILCNMLAMLKASWEFHVPHRIEDGYGLNVEALRLIRKSGVDLVVSVDCGIASVHEAIVAREIGLELIITDHHEIGAVVPDASVVVHPRLPGSDYPFGYLSGSAVAFKLAWRLATMFCGSDKLPEPFRSGLIESTALATLGIVADIVPLLNENRLLVKKGLAILTQNPPPGIAALMEAAKMKRDKPIRASDIGFTLGPRINAAGRLGCARMVVELLTTRSPAKAAEIAERLDELNRQRQDIEKAMSDAAREQLGHYDASAPAIVLAAEISMSWHPGVMGIVAGRLVESYGKPVIVLCIDGERDIAAGSGRSVAGFPLHLALGASGSHLISHGGHAMAAGLKLIPANIDKLRESFSAYAAEHFDQGLPPAPSLTLDAEVPLSGFTESLLKQLDKLEPYGAENRSPVFLVGPVEVQDVRRMGQGEKHLSFRAAQHGTTMRAVAFNKGEWFEDLVGNPQPRLLAVVPTLNEWNGRRSVELKLIDQRPSADGMC